MEDLSNFMSTTVGVLQFTFSYRLECQTGPVWEKAAKTLYMWRNFGSFYTRRVSNKNIITSCKYREIWHWVVIYKDSIGTEEYNHVIK